MQTWQKNLGASLQALGVTLMGVGTLPQLGLNPTTHTTLFTGIAVAGFISTAFGGFFAHLFTPDQTAVNASIQANNVVMHGANSPALPPFVPPPVVLSPAPAIPVAVSKAPLIPSKPS